MPAFAGMTGKEKARPGLPRRAFLNLSLRSSGGRLALLRKRSAGLGDNALEGLALVHRDVGQDLAVEIDSGELQAVHELAVGQAFLADGGIDALDPERSERALLHLAVAIGVLAGLLDGLLG